jgi:hypothetical protein
MLLNVTVREVASTSFVVFRESYSRHGTRGIYGTGLALSMSAVRPECGEV